MNKLYFMDNASTTRVFDEVFDIMKQNNDLFYFNPSASYMQSIETKKKLDEARKKLADLLHLGNGKLYFTSSATESNNTVFSGLHLRAGQTVLISAGEHPSVYLSAHNLEKKGINVIDIPLTKNGVVDEEKYKELLEDSSVALVSIMHCSNETGAINDIKRLCSIAKSVSPKIIFHSDGVQAFGKINVNLIDLGVDLYTISAHKVYSVRGIGGLFVKNGVTISPLILGGGQENGMRSSTENVAGAIAFAYCAEKVVKNLSENYAKTLEIKNSFLKKLMESKIAKFIKINSSENASPYIVSLTFDKIKGEVLIHALENDGILVSTGSACSAKKAGNRTLESMGLTKTEVIGSVRVSFSPFEDYDLDYIVECFEREVERFEQNV